MTGQRILTIVSVVVFLITVAVGQASQNDGVAKLVAEVAEKGWLVYAARSSENQSWDLFLSRSDGSQRRNITNTPNYEEGGPRFSPDSSKLLYRRFARGTVIDHDQWGFQGQLVIAGANDFQPVMIGYDRQYPWASWSPDGKQIACLATRGLEIVDLTTKQVVRRLPRKGIFQQLYWSADGKWFCGVANAAAAWTIVRMNANNGEVNIVHEFQSCTPDWFADSENVIYSSRPAGQRGSNGYGFTQLWVSDGEGKQPRLIYGEDGYHIYGGALSPDGKYVLFTKCKEDGGGSERAGAPMCIMRLDDAPIITGVSRDLRKLHPKSKDGPILRIGDGWEPCWTYADVGAPK